MRKITIDDVAALAEVSIKTVSRVINREPNVRKTTRQKVLEAARQLDYWPNVAARGLAGKNSYLIGLVYDNPSPSYLANLQTGVLETCRESGYGMVLYSLDSQKSNLIAQTDELIIQSRVSGLILTPPLSDNMELVQHLVAQNFAHALVSPPAFGETKFDGPVIMLDDRLAVFEMTNYLIKAGHRRIGFIKGHPQHSAGLRRFIGYCDALNAAGLAVDDQIIAQGYYSFDSGLSATQKILSANPRPTALFSTNDDMAAAAMHTALDMGLKVPDDLSVVGFDDTPLSRYIWPPMTTVRQPIRDMGHKAAEKLITYIHEPKKGQQIVMPFELKIRSSSAPLI